MTKKQRKPLNDALAQQFVYGDQETTPEPETLEQIPQPTPIVEPLPAQSKLKQPSLMEKLQTSPKEATKRFTVDLNESMHRKLSLLSARTGRSKADIVRMLLDEALKDVED